MKAVSPEVNERISNFVAGADERISAEVSQLVGSAEQGDESAIATLNDAFGQYLDFGTGGLRGIMGIGTNRMNEIVIAKSTQGLAQYVKSQDDTGSVAIAYDSRNNSKAFAQKAAQVVAGNGLIAYLFEDLRPTPQLSFAVRKLDATAGIVITASHNPKEYSGYKVSWNDGAQVLPPHDRAIIEQVRSVKSMEQVKLKDYNAAVQDGSIVLLGEEMDEAFLRAVDTIRLRPALTSSQGDNLKIVYTPLHGTGIRVVPAALQRWGFTSVSIQPEQAIPDGNFPTTKSPNPEERVALELALALARNENADIVLATDPDADRLGFAVQHNGDYQLITGNQAGALIAWYLCETLAEQNRLPSNAAMVTTIVTTRLIKAVTDSYGVDLGICLTGFKHIAALIRQYEKPAADGQPVKKYIMGCEESYGYMIGDFCRDKDAVGAACVVAEMTLWAKTQGLTLVDLLHQLYRQHGVHIETQISKTMPGLSGMEDMKNLMDKLRGDHPREIAGIPVTSIEDVESDVIYDLVAGKQYRGSGLPASNVLIFNLEDGSVVVARPSGTEPKIKFYFMVVDKQALPIADSDLAGRIAECQAKDTRLQESWLKIVS